MTASLNDLYPKMKKIIRLCFDFLALIHFCGRVRCIAPHKKLRRIGAVTYVDPCAITHSVSDSVLRQAIKDCIMSSVQPIGCGQIASVSEMDIVSAYQKRFVDKRDWYETEYYHRVCDQIKSGIKKFGCASIEAFDARLKLDEQHFKTIRDGGYKSQMELGSLKPWDEVRVVRRWDGSFLFVDGRHRLATAKVLQIPCIPVMIVAIEV